MDEQFVLEMLNIKKSFGGVRALDDVSLQIKKGEIHALLGENGAGKSTLIKILSGAHKSDSGLIKLNGKEVQIGSTNHARKLGISVIYQELNLVPELTIAENLFIGEELSGKHVFVSQKDLNQKAREVLETIDFDIDPSQKVSALSVGYMQMVEVAKAVSRRAEILVLDEPTAVLTTEEANKLFKVVRRLREKGTSVIYVSHRLEEIFALTDRLTILKDGKLVTTADTAAVTKDFIVTNMIGRKLNSIYCKRKHNIGDVKLEARGLSRGRAVKNVSFQVRSGEILGFAGLVGAGKTETMRLLFGADRADAGEIFVNGKSCVIRKPKHAIQNGICYVSEDRKGEGVLLDMSILTNITMPEIKKYTNKLGVIQTKQEIDVVDARMRKLSVKADTRNSLVSSLSGGNQQKVSLAKWILGDSEIIILDEPTRGVDVGTKSEIYEIISDLAEAGKAVIFISSEIPEISNMCDRVIVLKEGSISAELIGEEISEERIMQKSI